MSVCPRSLRTSAFALGLANVLAFVFVTAIPAGAQGPERVLYVSALDKAGKPVDTLSPRDIVVREDDVAREVLRVTRATEPMQIAILVDNSAAAERHITDMRNALTAFVKTIAPGNEVSLITYADRPTLLTNVSTSGEELQQGVTRIFSQPSAGAYVLDAIQEASEGFVKRESTRPVMIVIDTEGTEFSNTHYERALEVLHESGAQLHVLSIVDRDPDTSRTEQERGIVFDRGTRETGGRHDTLLSSMALAPTLDLLAAELKNQYRVVYARPESLIPPKEVKVSSARADLEIRGVPAPERRGTPAKSR